MSLTSAQKRAREQCYLISQIETFAARNQAPGGAGGLDSNSQEYQDIVAYLQKMREFDSGEFGDRSNENGFPNVVSVTSTRTYEHFVPVMAANPGTIINKLVSGEGIQKMFNLSPLQMSSIMPKMRIFKVHYSGEDDNVGTAIEFPFENHLDPGSIENMVNNRRGRGTGVGVKNFSWELLGTNTAEVDNNIKANLTLYFQNFTDLLNEEVIQLVYDRGPGVGTDQDIITALESAPDNPNYLDLIYRTSRFAADPGADGRRSFNEKYYRIKAILGWTVDQAMITEGIIDSELKDAIENVGTILMLSLTNHSIDFREDGSIELSLEYQAAVEGMMSDEATNILFVTTSDVRSSESALSEAIPEGTTRPTNPSELLELLDRRERELGQQRGAYQQQQAETGEEPSETPGDAETDPCEDTEPLGDAVDPDDLEDLIEDADEALAKIQTARRQLYYGVYRRFVSKLLRTGQLFMIDAPAAILEGGGEDSPPVANWGPPRQTVRGGTNSQNYDALLNALRDGTEGDGDSDREETVGEAIPIAEQYDPPGIGGNTPYDGTVRFSYFYFGSLLDIALDVIDEDENPNATADFKNLKIMLGTIFVPVPGTRGEANVLINLADVPISLNLFLQFFVNRTVGRSRTVWPLKEFVKEVITLLIYPALGSGCSEVVASRRPRSSVTTTIISAYSGGTFDEPIDRVTGRGGRSNFGGTRVTADSISALNSGIPLQNRHVYQYMIIQATDFSTFGRNALGADAPERDAADGLYWLNIGNDSGLVKSIKFKKTDQPGLRESRMEREGSLGLGQLRDKYDADVSLFGNSLFQPGQIIFINPTVLGLGTAGFSTRLSSVLGIGGYHQVITVDNNIGGDNYETILNTKWVAAGTGFPPRCANVEGDGEQPE